MTKKAALLVLSALATACLTPSPSDAGGPAQGGPPFVLEAGEMKIQDLIDRCAGHLRRNILTNEQEFATAGPNGVGTFKLQNRVETDRDGCEELLSTMLYTRGFAVVPLDEAKGIYEVLSMHGPRNRDIWGRAMQRTPDQVLARPSLKVPVTVVLELKHTNATIATNALRPFFASSGSPGGGANLTIGNVGNNTAMLVSGMQDQVANAIRLVKVADVPATAGAPPGVQEQVEALTQRVAALEKKLAAKDK